MKTRAKKQPNLNSINICYFDWRTFKLDAFNPDLSLVCVTLPWYWYIQRGQRKVLKLCIWKYYSKAGKYLLVVVRLLSLTATFLVLLYKIKGKPVLETTQVHPISKFCWIISWFIDQTSRLWPIWSGIRSRMNKYLYSKVK